MSEWNAKLGAGTGCPDGIYSGKSHPREHPVEKRSKDSSKHPGKVELLLVKAAITHS